MNHISRALGTLLTLTAATAALTSTGTAPTQAGTPRAAAAQAAPYTPAAGPVFSRRSTAIVNLLKTNIRSAPAGSTIRAATMTFSDQSISDALIRAADRGVHVKVAVAAKACDESAVNALQRKDAQAGSRLIVECVDRSGRGTGGTQHIKGMSFSKTGTRTRVVVLTSANFTKTAPTGQWNDAYQSVGWTRFYSFFNAVHAQIMADRPVSKPFRQFSEGASGAYATPQNPGQADPVISRINALPRRGLEIRIAQSALVGARGSAIADALIRKRRSGAKVVYVYSNPTVRLSDMARAGITLKMVDPPADDEFLHHKFMIASWINSSGTRSYRTWMGTEVWTTLARSTDEMVLQLASKRTYDLYLRQINYLLGV